jgi:hypothetical protein
MNKIHVKSEEDLNVPGRVFYIEKPREGGCPDLFCKKEAYLGYYVKKIKNGLSLGIFESSQAYLFSTNPDSVLAKSIVYTEGNAYFNTTDTSTSRALNTREEKDGKRDTIVDSVPSRQLKQIYYKDEVSSGGRRRRYNKRKITKKINSKSIKKRRKIRHTKKR